jgi:hypothetical protein
VKDFEKRGAGVLVLEWESFGDIAETVDKLTAVLDSSSKGSRTKELYDFVCDKDAVCRLRK